MRIYYCHLRLPIVLLGVLCFSNSCSDNHGREVSRGFYYWKTNVNVSDYERAVMDSLQSEYLYIRFFDVDINKDGSNVRPKAVVNFGKIIPAQEIIPVVFITTRALNVMPGKKLDFYAKNIALLIKNKAASIHLQPKEIQIDCDWTDGNKYLYFALLKTLKKQPYLRGKTISATIRMYQAKYPGRAGVPPVDKGLLMVYNMGELTNFYEKNSIITVKMAKQYLDHIAAYPLPLDIALPVYSWSLLFHKSNFTGILRSVYYRDLQNTSLFTQQENNRYLVRADTLFKGYYLKAGDLIRYENADFNTVNTIAEYLSSNIKTDSLRILLYHCDSLNFKNISGHEMEKIFSTFN